MKGEKRLRGRGKEIDGKTESRETEGGERKNKRKMRHKIGRENEGEKKRKV